MTRFALLLGGGGSVGIAWENGVLAGLADHCGFDPTAATVIVGTSAGSAVGADMALGKDPHDALAFDTAGGTASRIGVPDMETGPFAQIIKLMMSADARTPETTARIGALAREADTAFSEEEWVARFRTAVGTDEWPAVDLRITAASCTTGEPKVWTASDGIDLPRAVASSCAIPGFFPVVSFRGEHYMDGSRGRNYHARILAELDVEAAIYIGPSIAVAGVDQLIHDDMEAIAGRGVRVHLMLGSAALAAAGMNLMDTSRRPEAFEIGLADGAAHAAAVNELVAG